MRLRGRRHTDRGNRGHDDGGVARMNQAWCDQSDSIEPQHPDRICPHRPPRRYQTSGGSDNRQ